MLSTKGAIRRIGRLLSYIYVICHIFQPFHIYAWCPISKSKIPQPHSLAIRQIDLLANSPTILKSVLKSFYRTDPTRPLLDLNKRPKCDPKNRLRDPPWDLPAQDKVGPHVTLPLDMDDPPLLHRVAPLWQDLLKLWITCCDQFLMMMNILLMILDTFLMMPDKFFMMVDKFLIMPSIILKMVR